MENEFRRHYKENVMQLTRYTTLVLCIFQGYLLALSFQHPESYHTMLPGITDTIRQLGVPLVDDLGWKFRIVTVISLTTGTLLLMWLGDQITERGIGNGISLIITIGIVARLPAALVQAWKTFVPTGQGASQVNPMVLVLLVVVLIFVIAAVIAISSPAFTLQEATLTRRPFTITCTAFGRRTFSARPRVSRTAQ